MLSLYGENGLYELVVLAKKHNWQIFDTGLGQMIDLENPSNNGFENFQDYLKQILNAKQ
jgi:ABC-type Fe2+-enterobactin transport system substrate-binding protein